jgi:hypothetical protein
MQSVSDSTQPSLVATDATAHKPNVSCTAVQWIAKRLQEVEAEIIKLSIENPRYHRHYAYYALLGEKRELLARIEAINASSHEAWKPIS